MSSFPYFSAFFLPIPNQSQFIVPTFSTFSYLSQPHNELPFPKFPKISLFEPTAHAFPTFQWTPIPSFLFLPFNELPFPFIFLFLLPFNEHPFPHLFSYFSYLLMSPHSFPTFQWAPIPYSFSYLSINFVHFPSYSVSLLSYLSISSHFLIHFLLFLPLNKLKFPHSFSYLSMRPPFPISFPTFSTFKELPFPNPFSNLSMSFHSPFIFLLLLPFNELHFAFISYFSYLSMSSHSAIHFPTFHTFQWALIPLFIFLVFLPFIELPFPYSFSYFSYRTFQ